MVRTIHYFLIASLAFSFFFVGLIAHAEDQDRNQDRDREHMEEMQEDGAMFEQRREELKERAEQFREEAQTRMENMREEAKTQMEEVRERVKTTLEERREELKQQGFDTARARIGENYRRYTVVIDRIVENLENIIDRVQTRADELALNGVDTTTANTHLENARESLRLALQKAGEVTDVEITGEDTPRSLLAEYQEILKEVREHLKDAHQALREAVSSLKDAVDDSSEDEANSDEDGSDDE